MPIKVKVPKARFHQPLKGGGGIGQTEGKSIALVKSQWLHGKCSQWLAFLVHLDLPVSRPLGPLWAAKGLINLG